MFIKLNKQITKGRMDIQNKINQFQKIQSSLVEFIDEEANVEEMYQTLIQLLYENSIKEDRHELTEFLQLLSAISCNHFRCADFFKKIERIILFLEEEIKTNYTDSEIFNFFKKNKRILLFLSEKKIITSIFNHIAAISNEYKKNDYLSYFLLSEINWSLFFFNC